MKATVALLLLLTAACSSRPEGEPVHYTGVIGPAEGAAAFRARQNLVTYNSVSVEDQETMVEGAGFLLQHGAKVLVLSEQYDDKLPTASDERNGKDCFVKRGQYDDEGEWVDCSDVVPTSAMSPSSEKPTTVSMLSLDQAEDLAIKACQTRFGLTFKRMDAADDLGDYPNQNQRILIVNCGHPGDDLWRGNGVHDFLVDRATDKVMSEDQWYETTPCKLWDKNRTSSWCRTHSTH